MVNVVVVDDHELIRIATTALLAEYEELNVIADVSSGEEAVEISIELKPDIVITDIDMPGMGGIAATKLLIEKVEGVKVIALSRHTQSPYPEQILEAGASGYVNKGAPPESIIEAIQQVVAGGKYISPEVATNLIFSKSENFSKENPFDRLTKRERQVVLMLIDGERPSAISKVLGISTKTTFTHRSRIHNKLGTSNDVELTNLASRHQII